MKSSIFIASEKAVNDEELRKSLRGVMRHFRDRREEAVKELKNWEELREKARAIKKNCIDNNTELLEELETNIKRKGGVVHRARDADELFEIVKKIARRNNIKQVIKSKSMITEETRLNEYLEEEGIEVIETDLGELIIQLAGERPSHIIAPALHKKKEDIRALFLKKLGEFRGESVEELAQQARNYLRSVFPSAQMSITGVNFAVAEEGSIVLFENEGNIRWGLTSPRIHLAIMGLEKIVPTLRDLSVFFQLLPRSATGQRMTSYVSILGPRKGNHDEGAEEFHLVILDNGRSNILNNPVFKEILYCIRCGACINICPIYENIGGHSYQSVYPGPIGAVLSPLLFGIKQSGELPFLSTLCGACHKVCPLKIDIPALLLRLRENRVEEIGPTEGWEKSGLLIFRFLNSNRRIYNLFKKSVSLLQRFSLLYQFILSTTPLGRWTRTRTPPEVK